MYHEQMYNVQMYNLKMYNVQMYNVQMYNVHMYNVQMYNVQMYNVLNMSGEKLSSPRGDPGLLLCGPWGRPNKKKARYLLRPYGLF